MAKNPRLTVVPTALSSNDPPRKLGDPGRSLWDRVMAEYDISDSGGLEMLCQACQALDRAEARRAQGVVQVREHALGVPLGLRARAALGNVAQGVVVRGAARARA